MQCHHSPCSPNLQERVFLGPQVVSQIVKGARDQRSGKVPRVGYHNDNYCGCIRPPNFSQLLSYSLEVVEVDPLLLYYNVAILQCIQMKIP